jgi:hypothetical protein
MTSGTDRPASGRFRPATLTARPLVGSPIAQAMSAGLGLVTVAAAAPTVLVDGLLHGPDAMNGSARGPRWS